MKKNLKIICILLAFLMSIFVIGCQFEYNENDDSGGTIIDDGGNENDNDNDDDDDDEEGGETPPPVVAEELYNITVYGGSGGGNAFKKNDTATIVADVLSNKIFVRWTVLGAELSTQNPYEFAVTQDLTIVAEYRNVETYRVTAQGGTVNGASVAGIIVGEKATLFATPQTGKSFLNWTIDGVVVSQDASYEFVPQKDTIAIANYQALFSYTILLEGGTAVGGINGTNTFYEGTRCTIKPTIPQGKNFASWTENGVNISNEDEYSFTVTRNRTLVATFDDALKLSTPSADTMRLNAEMTLQFDKGNAQGTFEDENLDYIKVYIYSSLDANANSIGAFKVYKKTLSTLDGSWTLELDKDLDYSFSDIGNYYFYKSDVAKVFPRILGNQYSETTKYYLAAQKVAKANSGWLDSQIGERLTSFYQVKSHYTINVTNGFGGGQIALGESVTIRAIGGANVFLNWTEGNTVLSTQNPYTFTPTKDMNIVANYQGGIVREPFKTLTSNYIGVEAGGAFQFDRGTDARLFDNTLVDYVKVYIYTSNSASAQSIGAFRYHSYDVMNMAGNKIVSVNGYPTNGYIYANDLRNVLQTVLGASYSDATKYYFKAQVVVKENDFYSDSELSAFTSRGWINGKGEA